MFIPYEHFTGNSTYGPSDFRVLNTDTGETTGERFRTPSGARAAAHLANAGWPEQLGRVSNQSMMVNVAWQGNGVTI